MPKTFADGQLLTAADVNNELNPHTAPQIAARVAAGTVTITFSNAADATVSFTFPAGRFSVAPIIMFSPATVDRPVILRSSSVTATGGTVQAKSFDSVAFTGTVVLNWFAVQMTPAAAAG